MKKIAFLFIAGIFFSLLFTTTPSCNCGGAFGTQLQQILGNVKEKPAGTILTNAEWLLVANNKMLKYDSVGIEIKLDVENIQTLQSTGLGFSSAYACKPGDLTDNIKEVTITSNSDYNDRFPKGSNLLSIMQTWDIYTSGNKDFPSNINVFNPRHIYTFSNPPKNPATHTFTITYRLERANKVLTCIVPNVSIK